MMLGGCCSIISTPRIKDCLLLLARAFPYIIDIMHHQLGNRSPNGGGGVQRDEENNDGAISFATAKPLGLGGGGSGGSRQRRRYRRGDLALTILGISILILSVLHIVLHSSNVPHVNHDIVKPMTRTANSSTAASKAGGAKVIISPLHEKLKEFVNTGTGKKTANSRRDNREIPSSKGKGGEEEEIIAMQPKSQPQPPAKTETKTQPNNDRVDAVSTELPKTSEKAPPLAVATNPENYKSHNQTIEKAGSTVHVAPIQSVSEHSETASSQGVTPPPPEIDVTKSPNNNVQVDTESKEDNNTLHNPINIADVPHPVAHLNCDDHGGPTDKQIIDEMVFWSDIPSDSAYLSPMHPLMDPHTPNDVERYLTFEPDHGGWNNIRMAMETALVMSHAMGRTLVLPPEQRMYLLDKAHSNGQRNEFGFNDFFHLDAISIEHKGFKVITMEEFLTRVGTTGELNGIYPPANQTNWSGNANGLWDYLRTVGYTPEWDPWVCALAIPASTESQSVVELNTTLQSIMDGSYGKPKPTLEEFNGNPTPVNASMAERMREMLADRSQLCIYDKPLQETKLIHLKIEKDVRLLTHFYGR